MAETADIFVIDGEDAGTTPWEFDAVYEGETNVFELHADAAKHGSGGYRILGDNSDDMALGQKDFAEQTEIYLRLPIEFDTWNEADGNNHYINPLWDNPSSLVILKITWHSAFSAFGVKVDIRHNGGLVTLYDGRANNELFVGTDHWIELHFKNGEIGTGGFAYYLDGALIASDFTTYSTTNYKPDMSYIGFLSGNGLPAGSIVYLDDIVANTTGPIGAYAGDPVRRRQPIFLFG